ncbi:MAG: hypothetical protein ACJAT4_000401 [Granulosicoccus sp.]|jgi:hypothetical protein
MEREEFSFWIIKLEMIDLLVVLFFFSLKKKNQKILGEKNAFLKAGTRTLIFHHAQPAPFLIDQYSLKATHSFSFKSE